MAKPNIVIEVRGGCVVAVHALDPDTTVDIQDWDALEADTAEEWNAEQKAFETRMNTAYHEIEIYKEL